MGMAMGMGRNRGETRREEEEYGRYYCGKIESRHRNL